MKRKIIQIRQFAKIVDNLIKKRQLSLDDFSDFQRRLIENPNMGDMIIGTGGVRKARLKSTSKGKSGGFRVCYYFLTEDDEIFLISIYAKNVQEDLTMQQKKELKELAILLKGKYDA